MTEERRVEIVTPDPATAWSVLLPAGAPSHVGILLTEPAGRTVRLILHRDVALALPTAEAPDLLGHALLRTMQALAYIHRPTHWREGSWPMWWEYQLWEWVERPDTGPLTASDVLTIRLLALRSGSWVRYDAQHYAPVVIDRATWEATYWQQLTGEGGGRPWDPDHDWH